MSNIPRLTRSPISQAESFVTEGKISAVSAVQSVPIEEPHLLAEIDPRLLPPKKRKQTLVSFRIDEETYSRLKAYASRLRIPMHRIANAALEDKLDELKPNLPPVVD